MICDKNKRIKEFEQVLRQFVVHGKLFIKTYISKRDELEILVAKGEKVLGDDNVRSDNDSIRK